jgi:hypothetical protein
MFSFLPVVTDIANVAASLSLPSILPDDVYSVMPDTDSLSPSIERLDPLSPFGLLPKSIFFNVVV